MKRVCILQNGLARGGTDTFVVNLCRGLDRNKFDITVVNPSNNEIGRVREPEVLETGAKIIHTAPLTSIKNKLKHLYQLYLILRKGKFDVFQTNIDLFNGPNLLVAWLAKVPLRCCHSHNTRQGKEQEEGKVLSVRIYQFFMKGMCKVFSNRYCGCSKDALKFLYPSVNLTHVSYPTIINNGIDLKLFKTKIDDRQERNELSLTNKYHILTVGHLHAQKNPLFIAKIFDSLCKLRDDIDLIWVGEGILKDKVVSILRDGGVLDRVCFLGHRSDVNKIMQVSDLFILPSVFEGLGIVAIEAQAAGLPCLLSDTVPEEANCGGASFLPINKGVNIWVGRICEMVDGIRSLNVDDRKLNEFSIEHMCEQMTKVFES